VTTLQEHIEALEPEAWAALTKRAAKCAVEAAKQLGQQPPAELLAVAAVTEAQLIEHRRKNSGRVKRRRPTARMKLIEAEHRCALAEQRAREAEQDKEDAVADAVAARAEAQESALAAEAARERAAASDAESGLKELQLATERRDGQAALARLRGELDRVRADADAAVREQASAAQEHAEQGMPERAAERAAGQQALEELRAKLDQVRTDATAAIKADREQAAHAMAAARQGMEERIARVRSDAEQRVEEAVQARARAEADAESLRAQAEAARAEASQLLTIPVPPGELRPETRRIENALDALYQIDYALELGMAEDVAARIPLDARLVRKLVRTVQEHAAAMPQELANLPAKFRTDSQVRAAASYAEAAAGAFRAFLNRIGVAAQQLRHRDNSPDAEVTAAMMSLLADPQVQNLLSKS
jgi:colicin import membrane protein